MTLMLKKGKPELLADLHTSITSSVNAAFSAAIVSIGLSEYSDKIMVSSYNQYNNGKAIDLVALLKEYNRNLSESIARAVTNTIERQLYTQQEMEKDLGLHK